MHVSIRANVKLPETIIIFIHHNVVARNYIPPLTGKPEQQRLTMRGGGMTSISSRRRKTISGRPLPE